MPTDLSPLTATTVQWLQQHGFNTDDLNQSGRHQDSPLILASRQGRVDIVTELLNRGVNVNHRNMDGTNALWAAAVANNFDIAQLLLSAGIDLNNRNDNGATTLCYAASAGKTPWVWFLLNEGADYTLETLDGYSPLDLASNLDCLRLLRRIEQKASLAS